VSVVCIRRNAVGVLLVLSTCGQGVGDRARPHADAAVLLLHRVLIVRLHEVGKTANAAGIQHLLAILRVLALHIQHLMLLFLLEFVVEGLELVRLRRVASLVATVLLVLRTVALVAREDVVDVLAEGHLRAKPVH
jgi:hypothetical protein